MADVKELLTPFAEVAQNPSAQADAYLAEGRRIIGVGPYYVPMVWPNWTRVAACLAAWS